MSLELEAMRAYVTAKDATQYDGMLEGMVAVYMTHNLLKMTAIDLRLDAHASIANIKNKLYTHCGTNIAHMRLFLRSEGMTVRCIQCRGVGVAPRCAWRVFCVTAASFLECSP